MTIHHILRRHIVIVGMLIIAAGFIAASETLHSKTGELIAWMEGLIAINPALGMAVFVLLAMLSAMVAFFSSAVLAPVAVFAWGKTTCLALLWVGWLLGGIASYCIGRFLGRGVAATIIGEEKIAGWQSRIAEHTRWAHILLFQAVVPSEIPGYVLGILRYRFVLYLAALAITELPYVIVAVYLGESFLKGQGTLMIILGIAVVAVGLLVIQFKARQASSTAK